MITPLLSSTSVYTSLEMQGLEIQGLRCRDVSCQNPD
jgi:hypothetical protein